MHNFNLIENANDSLMHALQHMGPINENGAGDWKRIIVDLAHVLELLFKETLRRAHPAFVFDNIDKYPSANAFTVGAEKALKRIQQICDIQFSEIELSAINTARSKRNEIEHFEFSISDHEAKAIVGQVLSFIFKYAEEHLELEWKVLHLKDGNWLILRQYTEFYESHLRNAIEKIEADELEVIECSSCHNETFDIESEKCLVCEYEEEVQYCRWCKEPYIYSTCAYDEAAMMCPSCEWKDGYASAHCEKY